MTKKGPYHRIRLECDHDLWFQHVPDADEELYCRHCRDYRHTLDHNAAFPGLRVYHATLDFWSERGPNKDGAQHYIGGCTYDGCEFVSGSRNFYLLRQTMGVHYSQKHTRFGSKLNLVPTERLPRNARPPF